jgi:glycosyltransferase involved in cell wall biosynthesis
MRVLIVTKIFPNAHEPTSSTFNRQQFAALGKLCDVEVMATIPWYPGAKAFGRWSAAGRLTDVPREDVIDGLKVSHPRFLFVPRVGQSPVLYAASLLPKLLGRRKQFDVILGSWAHPDGVAAILLSRMLRVPAVIKLHGSDMYVVAKGRAARRFLRWALPRASRVVAVSRPLADEAAELGVPRERIAVVPNGVDRERFHPRDRAAARKQLGLAAGRLVVYVGRLEERKGVLDLMAAFERLPNDVSLALVGDGAARQACEQVAAGRRIHVAGARPFDEVPLWMAAADVVTLPSWNEGTPNVVIEALACGRRVVATRIGGIPDLVHSSVLGELVEPRDPAALADALARATAADYDAQAVAAAAGGSAWQESASRLHAVLAEAARNGHSWP